MSADTDATDANIDHKGLIREAYRIEGITDAQCRSIFLDWALSLPADVPQTRAIAALLERHGDDGHPMTDVLKAGLQTISAPRRRGGWRSRPRQ
ncbi:hypothetical protein [Pseudaestuariivita sp.]|uniref:hypothetical protein n=1 Tax=Pseudaestuariivita sp. TaxID=2211669 RepID=UPI004059167F